MKTKFFFWQFAHNLCKQLQLEFCADEATTEKFTTFPMLTGHFATVWGHEDGKVPWDIRGRAEIKEADCGHHA